MNLRSMLFIPGDSERKLSRGKEAPSDALVLDLEDSVVAERTELARSLVREYLSSHPDCSAQQLWVRINPLSCGAKALADLAAIVAGAPDGIMLPKITSPGDVVTLDHYLAALEAREGLHLAAVRIMPVVTETPAALFTLGTFAGCSARLAGLTWGAEDLRRLGRSDEKG